MGDLRRTTRVSMDPQTKVPSVLVMRAKRRERQQIDPISFEERREIQKKLAIEINRATINERTQGKPTDEPIIAGKYGSEEKWAAGKYSVISVSKPNIVAIEQTKVDRIRERTIKTEISKIQVPTPIESRPDTKEMTQRLLISHMAQRQKRKEANKEYLERVRRGDDKLYEDPLALIGLIGVPNPGQVEFAEQTSTKDVPRIDRMAAILLLEESRALRRAFGENDIASQELWDRSSEEIQEWSRMKTHGEKYFHDVLDGSRLAREKFESNYVQKTEEALDFSESNRE
eukprot:TRINITY_DN9802_c0_g1_i2.p1 TRINITY_DN9802_c0_g1~~TRINITY_DN9802_c0_g1_i2.p1  ORF type:complete len:296 (-),score=58.40 TRINITY_DN9802_c0_g1_i2:412-1272(-)